MRRIPVKVQGSPSGCGRHGIQVFYSISILVFVFSWKVMEASRTATESSSVEASVVASVEASVQFSSFHKSFNGSGGSFHGRLHGTS